MNEDILCGFDAHRSHPAWMFRREWTNLKIREDVAAIQRAIEFLQICGEFGVFAV